MKNQILVPPVSPAAGDAMSLVLNNVPEAVVLLDKNLTVIYCNRAAEEEILGKLNINIRPGKHLSDIVAKDRLLLLQQIATDVLKGKVRMLENRFTLPTDELEIYENTFLPARDEGGDICGIVIRSVNITKRKLADRAIHEAEERWQFAFEASNQAAWDWNMQTNEVIYSSSYKKMYGFLGDELGNDVSEWQKRIHPEDKGRIETAVQEHVSSDNPYYETTYRIQLKNGEYKWIMARGKLLSKDSQGRPLRMIGTHTDLTETLRTKEEIRKMNERFHYAAEASSQALWEWNAVTGEAYVSPSFTAMFGWEADENRRFDQWHQYVHPEDHDATVNGYYHTLYKTTQSTWEATYRFQKADGDYAVVSDKAYILRNEKNEVEKVIGATQDVTALKRAEEELVRSNERYNFMMLATNELLWEWDVKTNQVYRPKEGIKKVYDLDDDSTVKNVEHWMERIHPDDRERVAREMEAVLHGVHMQTFEIEYRFRRNDGGYNDIYGRGILLRDGQGWPVRMIGSEQNVSEKKQLERELLQNELEMKKRINQATVDSQEQERSDIGRELHDNINQVLTTTKLYVELAASNKEMADELLAKSSENIGKVITEIRQLSRSLMDPTIGDLGIVDSINDLAESTNLTGKVRIVLDLDPLIENTLEKNQKLTIFRIIQESLNNVIRHAMATFVSIEIKQRNGGVFLEIADDGIGFSPELAKRGAGLKNISNRVYLVNGNLAIKSSPGNGCRISINFPIQKP